MNQQDLCFEKHIPGLGRFALRALRIPADIPVVHDWVTRDYAVYWGMQGKTVAQVERAYRNITAAQVDVFLGLHDGSPAFLVERYEPLREPIGRHYDARVGDRGMHLLVAPPERRIPGFTWRVFTVVMDFLFSEPGVRRIVVEPDARNHKIHALNRRAGFRYQKTVDLPATASAPAKTAHLFFCMRDQYAEALEEGGTPPMTTIEPTPAEDAASNHLRPELWAVVNRRLVRKIISEFAHERLVDPELQDGGAVRGAYRLRTDDPAIVYTFRATVLALDHWVIDEHSIEKSVAGRPASLDALHLVVELAKRLGVSTTVLPTYMEEITSTLYGAAYKHANQRFDAAELPVASVQDVETSMAEGHPTFVANNGRIGFDTDDYQRYAPEAASAVSLCWLAAHKNKATFSSIDGLTHGDLMQAELGPERVNGFCQRLRDRGLDPADYVFVPVHPWQWRNKLAVVFAPEIAARHLVWLGEGEDRHLAQQSIRTFFNVSRPDRHYVKTSLSILNMGFMRGLSPTYMLGTPAINQWVHEVIERDPFLREAGFAILREVAAVGYRHEHYERAVAGNSPYKKMLAALWRESPVSRLAPGQRLMTMASLLHRDRDGNALLPALIRSSRRDTDTWLRCYLSAYLQPLLHCFYAHDMVFMPHGENVILVLEDNVPVRAFMKDIAEEVAILDNDARLPEKVSRLAVSVPDELKVLSLFTDVFDCFFRYLAEILVVHASYPESRFWRLVAACVRDYQRAHPSLREKFVRHDLFAPSFRRSCLNRLQLANNQQLIDLADPAGSLQFAGRLQNPIAPFADEGLV